MSSTSKSTPSKGGWRHLEQVWRRRRVLEDVEGGFAAFFHQLQAFRPSWNHAIQWERNGFTALDAGIKFLAVQKGAAVVNRHLVVGVRRCACAHHSVLILKARCSRVDAVFAAVFSQKRLTFFFDSRLDLELLSTSSFSLRTSASASAAVKVASPTGGFKSRLQRCAVDA